MATANITGSGYVPSSATRPTDPGLAFPIFRNGNATQLLAGAELKATEAGHQGAFSDDVFGGELAGDPELAEILGGGNRDADADLPASILRLRGHRAQEAPSATGRTQPTQAFPSK